MLDSYRGEGWGCREETGLKERAMSVFCVPGNSYIICMLWAWVNQGWWPRCGPMWCDCEALCVCVSSGDISVLHTTSQL